MELPEEITVVNALRACQCGRISQWIDGLGRLEDGCLTKTVVLWGDGVVVMMMMMMMDEGEDLWASWLGLFVPALTQVLLSLTVTKKWV